MPDAPAILIEYHACPKCGRSRPIVVTKLTIEKRAALPERPCQKCKERVRPSKGRSLRTDLATGMEDFNGPGEPPEPTTAAPGTEEKLAAMAARAGAGEQLHHPADPKIVHGPARVRFLAEMLERLAMRSA